MGTEQILLDFGLIVCAGLVSQPIAQLLRLPPMLVLVVMGALLGPIGFGLVYDPLRGLGAQLVFTIGVSMILFHGGTGVSLRVISRTAVGLGLLAMVGVLVTTTIVAVAVAGVFGVPFPVALMVGAVLSATDPAILIPLFNRLHLRPKVSQTVIAESAFNDPIATVLTLTVVTTIQSGKFALLSSVWDFSKSLALGAAIGIAAGLALSYLVSSKRTGIWRESPAAIILAAMALMYYAVEHLGGSGYLAAFVMGLVIGNMEEFGVGQHGEDARLLEGFIGQIADIATLLVFITLGANLPVAALESHFLGGLVIMAVFIFVARPLAVAVCLLPDRRGNWTRQEILFVSWCRETGVIPAAVASLLLAEGVQGASLAVSMVALAVFATLLLQATTAGIVARRLGLVEEPKPAPG